MEITMESILGLAKEDILTRDFGNRAGEGSIARIRRWYPLLEFREIDQLI